jgi:hypothetical protein
MATFKPDPLPILKDLLIAYKDERDKLQTWTLRPGILMSECAFVGYLNVQAEHKALLAEVAILMALQEAWAPAWIKAENKYQTRIVELEGERDAALKPSLWDEVWDDLKVILAFVAGAGLTAAVIFGSAELVKAQAKWSATAP